MVDTSGTLNFAEFLVLMVKNFGVNGVQDAFLSYDVDGSGSITRDELKARFLIKEFSRVSESF